LANPSACQIEASFSHYRNIKGKPEISGELPYPSTTPLYLLGGILMGLGKPQPYAEFEFAGFIYYENIREFVFKNWDKPKWGTPYIWRN